MEKLPPAHNNQNKSKNLSSRGARQGRGGQQNQGNRRPNYGRQDRRRVEEPADGSNGNYEGPGTGSYLERRGNSTAAQVPNEEFDIQSSNARFDKGAFKEQLNAKKSVKAEESENKDTQSTQTASIQGDDLNDLMKKLKTEKQPISPSNLSPSAQVFIPASESKKEKEKEKSELPTTDVPKYEKKDFYDDISTDREINQRREMVKKDTETFGESASNYGYYNRQRPRYFSSGGNRGRGRGGWRGGNSGYGRSSLTAQG